MEFDIESGSNLKIIFPGSDAERIRETIEKDLCEKMLPDGIHNREIDFSIFFLNRISNENINISNRLHKFKGTLFKALINDDVSLSSFKNDSFTFTVYFIISFLF